MHERTFFASIRKGVLFYDLPKASVVGFLSFLSLALCIARHFAFALLWIGLD